MQNIITACLFFLIAGSFAYSIPNNSDQTVIVWLGIMCGIFTIFGFVELIKVADLTN